MASSTWKGYDLVKGITISRLMGPNEANVYGNIHGGHIMNLIDEAAIIIASRYCNHSPSKPLTQVGSAVAVLTRIEHMDFILPMHIGEVAELAAEIVYTAEFYLEVTVTVWAENIIKGHKRMTNRARLWYMPVDVNNPDRVLEVPPMCYESDEARLRGEAAYFSMKADRARSETNAVTLANIRGFPSRMDTEFYTVANSRTCLSQLIGPTEVSMFGICRGGVILKLMDECAGYSAWRHCKRPVVTACIDSTNFHNKILAGCLVSVYSWVTFTSSRSVEIEVIVEFERAFEENVIHERAVDALLTFVCLDSKGRAQPVSQLLVVTEEEAVRFAAGKKRYEKRKEMRLEAYHSNSEGTRV